MRDPAELLAMLCPKGLQVGQSFGGVPRLTALDIAGACGMGHMTKAQSALLMIKYCLELEHIKPLHSWWVVQVTDKAADEGWRTETGKPRMITMATLTLIEHLEHNTCRVCNGRGEFHAEGQQVILCPSCAGSGRKYQSQRAIARAMELDESSYRQTWVPRFAWCRRHLQAIEHDALQLLKKGL